MNNKIKILHLEDNPADSSYVKELLIHDGFEVDITLAENKYEFEMAVNSGKEFDLVLSDFTIPGFNGFEALKMVKEKMPEVPFILVSGEVDEEQAVESMKLGAAYYVFKHRMIKLGPAVKKALDEYGKRKEHKKTLEYLLLLSRAIEATDNGVFITDHTKPESPITFINKAFETITGFTKEEIMGKSPTFLHKNDKEQKQIKIIMDAVQNNKPCSVSLKNYKKNGTLFWNELHLSPVKNEDGVVTNYIGTINDVTEKVMDKEKIVMLSRSVEQSTVAIVIADNDGLIEYVNPMFEEISGYKSEEVKGKNPVLLFSDKLPGNFWQVVKKSIEEKNEFQSEFECTNKNGKTNWRFLKVSSLKNSKDVVTHYLMMYEDISLRKKAELDIIGAKEKAEEMNKLKSALLTNISHELRTPLIAIMGYAKLLSEKLTDDDQKEMSDIIYRSGDRLKESLDNILDLSTIESGAIKINKSGIDVERIIKETAKKFAEAAYLKGLTIKVDVREKITVKADEHILTKVISNLINNAIKYTNKGNITITVGKTERDGKKAALIKIVDTGIGIHKENYKRIFESFRQGSEGLNRNYEGLGLGLTITKKFLDMMGCELYFESSVNKGSVFSLIIPAVYDETFTIEKYKMKTIDRNNISDNEKKYNVLIVEDDQTTRDLLKLFVSEDYYATEVSSGEDAVEFAKERKFDAVLMDISLNGINGLDAAKLIRHIPGYSDIPIIAVTAFAMRGDKEKFLNEGCSQYLSKPFSKKTIIELLQKSISESLIKQSVPEIIYN